MIGILVGGAFVAGVAVGPLAVAASVAVLLSGRLARGRVGWLLPAMVVVAAAGWWRAEESAAVAPAAWVDDVSGMRGVIASGPVDAGGWQRFDLRLIEARIGDDWTSVEGRLCASGPVLPTVGLGDRVRLIGWTRPLADLPPGAASFYAARGCLAQGFGSALQIERRREGAAAFFDDVRRSAAGRLQRAAPGDAGALLAGLVTGNDEALSPERRDAFIRTGTTHITAVSGSNVALLVVALVFVGGQAGLRHRLVWVGAVVGLVWLYALMVGLQPPQVRAAMVASAAVLAPWLGRRADVVTLIVLAAAVELAVKPADVHAVSFQFSYASALALALALSAYGVDAGRGVLHRAARGAVVAQLATVPISAATFGVVSVTALPANLLIALPVGLTFQLAAVAAALGFVSDDLGRVVALPAELLANAIIWIVEALASPRFAQLHVGSDRVVVAVLAVLAIGIVAATSGETRRAIGRWRPRSWLAPAASSAGPNRLTRKGREG